jgi:REP element-mobilizing transposase RayT
LARKRSIKQKAGGAHMPTYFVTFTSYGTWLHGDERGSHDRKGTTERTARLAPDPTIEAQMRLRMKHEPFMLNGPMRKVVREAIVEHCDYRRWLLREISVRTNHVHLVVVADAAGSRVLNSVKARATRALREAMLLGADRPVWTERGSCRVMKTEQDIASACTYVREGQGPELPDD